MPQITIENIPFVINVIFLSLIAMLVLFKYFNYHKISKIEFLAVPVLAIAFVLCNAFLKSAYLIWETVFNAYLLVLFIYSTYNLYQLQGMKDEVAKRTNYMISNIPFDAYYFASPKDIILDCSNSFCSLINLDQADIIGTKGLSTILDCLNIQTINGNPLTSSTSVRLSVDYENTVQNHKTYFFHITYLKEEELLELRIIVEPIYYKNIFLGRNVYFAKGIELGLDNIKESLEKAKWALENDRSQLYTMMSIMNNVIMYYDFNTKTYVMTESMATYLGLTQREFTINEYLELIKPSDLKYYEESSSVISSSEITKMNYHLKFGDKYYYIEEDAMYLNRDENLISVIKLAPEKITEVAEEVESATPKPKEVDYQAKFNETIKLLEKIVDE